MASTLRRTDNLQNLKVRELWLQDTSGTYAQPGSVLYTGYNGRVLTHSQVYVTPTPGDFYVPGTLDAGKVFTHDIELEGPCAALHGAAGGPTYSRVWMKQQPSFNTPAQEVSNAITGSVLLRNMRCVACDLSGNTFVAYTTEGTIPTQSNTGSTDIVVAKFDSAGNLVWVVQNNTINTPYADSWPSLTVSSTGDVYVGYYTNDIIRLIYFKLDGATGARVWINEIESQVYGQFSTSGDTLQFLSSHGYAGPPGPDIYKVNNSSGALTLVATLPHNPGVEIASAIAPSYLFVLTCTNGLNALYQPPIDNLHIDRIDISTNAVLSSSYDAAYNPLSWGTQYIATPAISVGPDGHPVISYMTASQTPSTVYSGSGVDIVVAKLNAATLAPLWIRQFSSGWKDAAALSAYTASGIGTALTSDIDGRILILYTTNYGSDIDLRVKTFDASGTELSTFAPPFANTLTADYVPSIATVPGTRDFVMAYHTDGRVSGGDITGAGNGDLVVARFTPTEASIVLQPAGGYVGVGTCNPGKPLDVRGTAAAATLLATGGDPAGSGGYKYITNSGAYMTWNPDYGSGLSSLNNERGGGLGGFEFTIHDHADPSTYIKPMSILHTTNGPLAYENVRVGVCTTNPAYTLDVSGTVRANQIIADTIHVINEFETVEQTESSQTTRLWAREAVVGRLNAPNGVTSGYVLDTSGSAIIHGNTRVTGEIYGTVAHTDSKSGIHAVSSDVHTVIGAHTAANHGSIQTFAQFDVSATPYPLDIQPLGGDTNVGGNLNVAGSISGSSVFGGMTGEVRMWAGTDDFVPDGWLLCDGGEHAISDYPALYDVIGWIYYNRDDDKFNVPDMRGRVPVGVGQGAGLTNRSLGSTGGAEAVALNTTQIPAHTHSFSGATAVGGEHTHTFVVGPLDTANSGGAATGTKWGGGTSEGNSVPYNGTTTSVGSAHSHSVSGTTDNGTGSGMAHQNMQPFLSLNFIIKT